MTALRDFAFKHRAFLTVGFSLGLLLIVCLHWWHAGYVIAQDDSPPMLTPGIWFAKSLGGWSNYNAFFGQVDGEFTFLPYMIVWWLADRVFGAGLGQVVMIFLVAAAAWAGAYKLVRALGVSVVGAAVGAWLYVINPFTQIVFGHQLTEGIFFALLAWLGALLVTAAVDPTRRSGSRLWLTGMAFALLPTIGVTPVLVFQMALSFVVLAALCTIFTPDRHAFPRWAAGCGGLMAAASLWWVVPDALSFVGASVPHPTSLSALDWIYAQSSLLNNLRFLYTWLWGPPEYYPVARGYDADPLTYGAGFFAVAISAAGLIVLRGRALLFCRYALGIALIVMFVSKGSHGPLAWVNQLFAAVPGAFLAYGDPGGEVALALLLLAIVSAMVVDRPAFARRRGPIVAGALTIIFLAGIDLLNGSIFHGGVFASGGGLMPSEYVAVPAYWRSAADYLNGAPAGGGVLMLPPQLSPGYDVRYDFGYYGSDAVATNLFARRLLYLDAGLTGGLSYVKHLESQSIADHLRDLLGSGSPLAASMIRDLGIRYVVYRGDIVLDRYGWYSQDELTTILRVKPMRFGPLAVYDLGASESAFALRPAWIVGSYAGADAGDMAELAALEEPLPRVDLTAVPPGFPGRPALIERATGSDVGTDVPGVGAFAGAGTGIDRAVRLAAPAANGGPEQPIVVKSAEKNVLRVSLGAASARLVFADVPVTGGGTTPRADLVLLAARILGFDERASGLSAVEEVRNLDRRAVYADIVVPVPADPVRTYALVAAGSRYLAAPERASDSLVVRFKDVLLLPGTSSVGLYGTPAAAPVRAAARSQFDAARQTYAFYFTSVRPTGVQIAVGALPGAAVPAWFDLPLSGSDHGFVEVLSGSAPSMAPIGAAIAFTSGGVTYRCPTALYPGQELDLDRVVAGCLQANLLPADVGGARMRSLEILDTGGLEGAEFQAGARADALVQSSLGAAKTRTGRRGDRAVDEMFWQIDPASAARGDIVAARVAGCVPGAETDAAILLEARSKGGRRATYRQRLFPTADALGAVAAIDTRRAFPNGPVTLTAVTATCESSSAAGSSGPRATLSLVRPRGDVPILIPVVGVRRTLAVARGGVAEYPLPHRGAPLAVRFGDLPAETSVAAAGAPPRGDRLDRALTCETVTIRCGAGWIRAGVPAGYDGLAVFGQLYSPTWIAVELGGGIRFPEHVRADGWRNAWFVSGPGTLLVFNAMDILIVAGLLLGLGVIGWQLRYRSS